MVLLESTVKKRVLLSFLVCSIALMSVFFAGCNESGDPSERIIGTWQNNADKTTVTFNADGTWVEDYIPGTSFGLVEGTYVIEGEKLTMTPDVGEGNNVFDVAISGRTLTLTSPAGAQQTYTRQ